MKKLGLLGRTLKHSFSQNYFGEKFKRENLTGYSYENFEISSIDEFPLLLKSNPDLIGLNVTIPYKEAIIPFLSEVSEVVEKTGACNCIKISNGKLVGYNTDVAGFKHSIEPHLKPYHQHALVLGTGGASKAVIFALDKLGIQSVLVSRNKDFDRIGYEDIGRDTMEKYKLVINTTPLGMYPDIDNDPPFPYEYITSQHLFYDLVYNPPETKFLKKAKEKGAAILNGLVMLQIQAEESWKIWEDPEK
jgi:shikimate dehydrogenase